LAFATRRPPPKKSYDAGKECGYTYFVIGANAATDLAPVVAELAEQ